MRTKTPKAPLSRRKETTLLLAIFSRRPSCATFIAQALVRKLWPFRDGKLRAARTDIGF
jgi:hypothetical protein